MIAKETIMLRFEQGRRGVPPARVHNLARQSVRPRA